MASPQRIGLIGAGLMGHGIARNILEAGYSLVVLDHPGNQLEDPALSVPEVIRVLEGHSPEDRGGKHP